MQPNTPEINNQKPKKELFRGISNKPLLLILCLELVLALGLTISIIVVNNTQSKPELVQDSNETPSRDGTENDENESIDERPNCAIEKTTDEPFASLSMDYPYAGVYESTGKYLCNTDLNYAVSIPKNVSKVYYYTVNGGQTGILGLKIDGEIMSNPLSPQSNFVLESAGIMLPTTEKSYQESLELEPTIAGYYTVVFEDATPPLLNNSSSDSEEAKQLMIALYGEENPKIMILYQKYLDPQLFEESPELVGALPTEMMEQLKTDYANRNQELNELVDSIFGDKNNYHKMKLDNSNQDN